MCDSKQSTDSISILAENPRSPQRMQHFDTINAWLDKWKATISISRRCTTVFFPSPKGERARPDGTKACGEPLAESLNPTLQSLQLEARLPWASFHLRTP